jgi:hypothetical protein
MVSKIAIVMPGFEEGGGDLTMLLVDTLYSTEG